MTTASEPPAAFTNAQVIALGYRPVERFVAAVPITAGSAGLADDPAFADTLDLCLIGFVDEAGRAPDFCLLTCEGFPNSSRIVPEPFAVRRERMRARCRPVAAV